MISLSIISAEEKRKETEIFKAAYEALRNQRIEQVVKNLFNMAKNRIEKEKSKENRCSIFIDTPAYNLLECQNDSDFEDAVAIVRTLLEKAGYTIDIHMYSNSWRSKSGSVALISISW